MRLHSIEALWTCLVPLVFYYFRPGEKCFNGDLGKWDLCDEYTESVPFITVDTSVIAASSVTDLDIHIEAAFQETKCPTETMAISDTDVRFSN